MLKDLKRKITTINRQQWKVIALTILVITLTFLPLIGYKRKIINKTLWQKKTKFGINKVHLLSSPDSSTPDLIVGGIEDLYSLDAYTGAVHWSVTSLPPPYSNVDKYSFPDTALADIDNDGKLEFLVGPEIVFNGTLEGLDVLGGLYIFDPYTGALKDAFYYGNGTWDIVVGTFKPCNGKGIILAGDYYLTGFPYSNYSYQFFLILDGATLQPVYSLHFADPTITNGFEAVTWISPYDLNFDGYDEIILSVYNNTVFVLDGKDFHTIWNTTVPSLEIFGAWDCDFYDITSDGTPDLVLSDTSKGICAIDGSNGTVLWFHSFGHGRLGSAIADVDNDGKVEVVTTLMEDLYIVDGLTGTIEVHQRTPFYFDASNVNVLDIYNNGSLYIFATSFYGGAYLFSPSFAYLRKLNVPHGWIHDCLFTDLNHDGTLELLGGCFDGSNAAFLYSFCSTFTYPSFLYLFLFLFPLSLLLSLFFFFRPLRSLRHRSHS